MSSNRKKLIFNRVSVSFGCSSCKKPKLTSFFNPKPKPKSPSFKTHSHYSYSSSSSSKKTTHCSFSEYETATSFSPSTDTPLYCGVDNDSEKGATSSTATVRGFGRVGRESLAVEKHSDDPYLDFRHSMLQMILEKEIYSKDDLRELLNCFLQLNSPYYHGIIVRAFTEIWNGVFSSVKPGVASSSSSKLHFGLRPRDL
ncbi:Transcription repressor OFP8 [Hibiscus syriacus]|uniref:Transcription repressor n=1 Tax=Hibiscus syriacus TaxID=106335 RepID=A0A6A2ZD46_HIBSY|nr:transcription repressor OFP6-like [Hibiscus syriacus]KAE8689941.1 Transcription repressor OFP8 [Hibiscus syriacus]